MAAVLANGGGFYHPFAYVAEAMRMGLTVHPPDVNASEYRCTGRGRDLRIGLQFIKGLSHATCERLLENRKSGPFHSIRDLQQRARLPVDDLRQLIKIGALDTIAEGYSRPMLLWQLDAGGRGDGGGQTDWVESGAAGQRGGGAVLEDVPRLKPYSEERRRREEHAALGFLTSSHPMALHAEALRHFRLCRSTELHRHVGRSVLVAGMLTTAKPVRTVKDEPMQFATFDDGHGLIESVLFPDLYRKRGHVLFDQGPFLMRGTVTEDFGAISLTITDLDRLERIRP
jgi:DNA polymerase III alpha subunit